MFENIPTSCRYGYARVSSKSQEENSSLESQKQEFIKLGVPQKNIRIEVGSAADTISERPIFYNLIDDELKENDLLLVTKIDRCSRNTLEFLKLQEKLFKKGVTFISLDLPYSNDMAVNKLIATNLAAIATFEHERRKERQRQGIQAAKKGRQVYWTQNCDYTQVNCRSQISERRQKTFQCTQIAKITGRGQEHHL